MERKITTCATRKKPFKSETPREEENTNFIRTNQLPYCLLTAGRKKKTASRRDCKKKKERANTSQREEVQTGGRKREEERKGKKRGNERKKTTESHGRGRPPPPSATTGLDDKKKKRQSRRRRRRKGHLLRDADLLSTSRSRSLCFCIDLHGEAANKRKLWKLANALSGPAS